MSPNLAATIICWFIYSKGEYSFRLYLSALYIALCKEDLSSRRHAIEFPQKNSYCRQKNWQGSPLRFKQTSKSTPANL